jgi:hypothetical protein
MPVDTSCDPQCPWLKWKKFVYYTITCLMQQQTKKIYSWYQ